MAHKITNLDMEIVLKLLNRRYYLRELAKELNFPHITIARRINNLKTIIDYETKGKNKMYYLKENSITKKYIEMAENYKCIKLFEKYNELPIISEKIMEICKKVPLIMLFGSYAKDTVKKESDIDLYIETTDRKIKKKINEINPRISAKIGRFDKNNLLIKEIIKNHVIIKGGNYFYEKYSIFT